MLTKNLTITDMDEAGKGLALLADLTAVDSDGDSYEPGAFSWKEQWVPLLPGHNRLAMPFGKARVFEEGDKAYAEFHLNLGTQAGKDWHSALKFDLAHGKSVQEWSYGYEAVEFDKVFRQMKEGRVLKRVDVHEVSTVVRGAGAGTRTISMKALKAQLKEGEFDGLIEHLGMMADTLKGDPGLLSATGRKQLSEIHASLGAALVDPAEAEEKAQAAIRAEIEAAFTHNETRDTRMLLERLGGLI